MLMIALEVERYAPVVSTNELENLFLEICNKKKEGIVILKWSEVVEMMKSYEIEATSILELLRELDKLVSQCLVTLFSIILLFLYYI